LDFAVDSGSVGCLDFEGSGAGLVEDLGMEGTVGTGRDMDMGRDKVEVAVVVLDVDVGGEDDDEDMDTGKGTASGMVVGRVEVDKVHSDSGIGREAKDKDRLVELVSAGPAVVMD
jgi:hypothetical protein